MERFEIQDIVSQEKTGIVYRELGAGCDRFGKEIVLDGVFF